MGNSVMLNGIEYAGEQIAYKDSTYELVSKVAYLIGVPLISCPSHTDDSPSNVRPPRTQTDKICPYSTDTILNICLCYTDMRNLKQI